MRWITRWTGWFKHLKLARKLILIQFVLIVIPLSLLGAYAYNSFVQITERNIGEYQLQTMKQVTLNIDTYMNELVRLTVMPYQYEDILDYLGSKREPDEPLTLEEIGFLNDFVAKVFLNGRIDIMGVALYGQNGASYVVKPESQYVTSYMLDESAAWLRSAEGRKGKPIFIPTHEVESTSGTVYEVFSIARELRSFDSGETLGFIVIDIHPDPVRDILLRVNLGHEEWIYIVDETGQPVISKDGSVPPTDVSFPGGMTEGVFQHEDVERGGLLVAHVTSPLTEWSTVGIVPVSVLMKDSLIVRNSIFVAGVLFVGLAMILSVIIAYRITDPLRMLSKLMRKVERGDLQVSFPVKRRDEVGHLGSAFNMMVSRLSELGYLLYETEIREKDAQIAALQSKINPHFLYNTLGSISMYAEVSGNREVVTMANNLGRLLRYSLRNSRELVTLRDELKHVDGYMTIQKMRYEERLNFTLHVEEELLLDCQMMPLLIQPIVENAIQHGMDQGVGNGNISLRVKREEDTLCIMVEDDGVGLTPERLETVRRHLGTRELGDKTGNGLLNVHRRIQLHCGEPYGVALQSKPYHGLQVMLTLPIRYPEHRADAEHVS